MSMQSLRTTTDAREFSTRLLALRNANRYLDAIDIAEISALRTRIDECDDIASSMISAISVNAVANCVASSMQNALLAIDLFAVARGEQHDCCVNNDGSVDAWGWTDQTPDSDMEWRVRIRITEGAE